MQKLTIYIIFEFHSSSREFSYLQAKKKKKKQEKHNSATQTNKIKIRFTASPGIICCFHSELHG